MEIANKYCIYAGSTRGILQWTNCIPNEKTLYSKPDEASEITTLEWGRFDDEILIGYRSGKVQIYNTLDNKYKKTIQKLTGDGPVTGLAPIHETVIIARRDGIINLWNKNDFFSINLDELGTLDCMVHHRNRENIVGTGGEVNDFKLWNVETQQCIFKAKSMGHDFLNLPIPTSIRGIAFIPESEHLAACATKQGHVLLYDDRAQRRPITKFFEQKASYTCISPAFNDKQVLVGTARGHMQLLDLKAPGKSLKTITGYTGSVTSIVCDPINSIVATTSLDRFLRVHNLDSKELVYKVYLKQSLSKLLLKPIVKDEKEEPGTVQEQVDEEYENLFDNMEVIQEKIVKKKRKSVINNDLDNNESVKIKKKKKKIKS